MNAETVTVPQPLTGIEIRKGIAARMTVDLPEEHRQDARDTIAEVLGKICTLTPNSAYSKFRAEWSLQWWLVKGEMRSRWEIKGILEDYGRTTPFSFMSGWVEVPKEHVELKGEIPFTPPDRFRRETDQPIPKAIEIKKPEPERSTFSRSDRVQGKRRDV